MMRDAYSPANTQFIPVVLAYYYLYWGTCRFRCRDLAIDRLLVCTRASQQLHRRACCAV